MNFRTNRKSELKIKGHRHWLWPLILAVIIIVGTPWILIRYFTPQNIDRHFAVAFLGLGIVGGAIVGPIVLVASSVRNAYQQFRRWRQSHGKYTKKEFRILQSQQLMQAEHLDGWAQAQALKAALLSEKLPQELTPWEVVPYPNEKFYGDFQALYSRYYGQDVFYKQSSGFYVGSPAFVATGFALTSAANYARRKAAESEAQIKWRDWQNLRVLVSNYRILCFHNGYWLSFDYQAMTALYPDLQTWSLVCQFGSEVAPLLLSGKDLPWMSVLVIYFTQGPKVLASHPGLNLL